MNYLNNSSTYLVGPIENTHDCFSWREAITPILINFGIKVFNPNVDSFLYESPEDSNTRAFLSERRNEGDLRYIHSRFKEIIRRDLRYVDLSTFIIANIDPVIPTWGSVHEIIIASQQKKPILIYTPNKKTFPMWMCGVVNPDLIFETWEELVRFITQIDSGEIFADPKYWKLLTNKN
jgi:hypothetical protein